MKKLLKIWTLDTETRGMFGKIFRIGLYDGSNYFASNSVKGILKIIENQNYIHHIFIHNLDFDIAKMSDELLKTYKIIFDKSIFINNSACMVHMQNENNVIIFHDTYKLLNSSLKKLSKDFELKEYSKIDLEDLIYDMGYKSKDDFFKRVPPYNQTLNKYLKLDCISLFKLLIKLCDIGGFTFAELTRIPTTASLAMRTFKTLFEDDYYKAVSTKYYTGNNLISEDEMLIRSAYYGGRTEVFKPIMQRGYSYDVNSLYPYVMKKYKIPYGKYQVYTDASESIYNFIKRSGIGVGFLQCKIYIPESLYIPPLPYRDLNNKLLFPVGVIEGCWCTHELIFAEKMGCKILEYNKLVYFKNTDYILKNYVEYFENIKLNSSGAKKQFAKLCLNTLYGKFGMNRLRSKTINIDKLEKIPENTPYTIFTYNRNIKMQCVEYKYFVNSEYIQPHIAACITSLARLELLKGLLRQYKKGDVYYCDTDSITCSAEMDDNYVDNKIFGKFKMENEVIKGVFIQPKLYAKVIKEGKSEQTIIHGKGIPADILKTFTYEDFKHWIDLILKGEPYINVYSNLSGRKKYLTMIKNNDSFDVELKLTKNINLLQEQKRQIDYKNNTTAPHMFYGDLCTTRRKIKKCINVDNSDIDVIEADILKYGKISPIQKLNPLYILYTEISEKAREKFFDDKGIFIKEFCDKSGWDSGVLLKELKYYDECFN